MKSILLTAMILGSGLVAQAKVSDFNALIGENIKSQKQLLKEVRSDALADQKTAVVKVSDESSQTVAEESNEVNVPTNKAMLKFAKEQNNSKISKKSKERLAKEFKQMDQEL